MERDHPDTDSFPKHLQQPRLGARLHPESLNYYRSVTKVPKPLPAACGCCSAGSWIRPEEMGHESDALTKDLASQQNMMAVSTAHPFWILLAMMTVVVHYIYHKLSQFCGLGFLTLNCTHYA